MALLNRGGLVLFLSLASLTARAEVSAAEVAKLYRAQNWTAFFAKSYLYRAGLRPKLERKGATVDPKDFSVLILESLAYLRHCHFDMARNDITALRVLAARSRPESAAGIKTDLDYLEGLLTSATQRQAKRSAGNLAQAKSVAKESKRDLWSVPQGQAANVTQLKQTPTLAVNVQNLCPKRGVKND